MNPARAKPRSAFTLIELLVVISIIATLASMLLPAIGSVRALAKQSSCASNQHQMMAAFIAYAGENEGVLPPVDGGAQPAATPPYPGDIARSPPLMLIYWDFVPSEFLILPVTSNGSVRYWNANMRWPNPISCPSVDPGTPNNAWYFGTRWGGVASEKQINAGGSMRLDNLSATVPWLAEVCRMDNPLSGGYWPPWGGTWPGPRLTHRQRANVSYKDGHTAARTVAQLKTDDGLASFNFWSPP